MPDLPAAPHHWLHLDWILVVMAAWLLIGVAGVAALRRFTFVSQLLFPLGGLLGLALFVVAVSALPGSPEVAVLPIGLPSLPFHLRLDSLSAYFLMVIGAASAGISAFAAGYFRKGEGTPPGLLCLEYHVFLASMAGVLLADDAYAFMVMWETMALSSFFLVTANHRIPEVRSAGYLYITMAHIGAIAILLCFGVLQANTGDYTFANMRAQNLGPFWASVGFLLAVFGFGAKAGILPLHVWLPEAHPAAPSPVSALMSGVMLNCAIYGLLRVSLDLLHLRLWWWGGLLLALGLATALFGVVFAAVQTDMKRLLAYSSIENMGLLFVGMGLTLIFAGYDMLPMAALSLTATLYHVASHACFKSLLFLGTGSVLHATSERNLGKLGGLIRTMPWVGWLTLLGVLASAGLPPLGGFVSEWLLLQSFLFTPGLPVPLLTMLIPVVAAVIALVAALAGYVMVKFFGVIFLGQPREDKLAQARDAGRWERGGMVWLAAGLRGAGPAAGAVHPAHRPRDAAARASRAGRARGGQRLAAGAQRPGAGELRPGHLPARHPGLLCAGLRAGALALPRPHAARPALGLRLPLGHGAHAGHRRRLRPAHPPDLRALLRHAPRTAVALRRPAALPRQDRRPLLALGLRADRGPGQRPGAPDRPAAAGPHLGLPALQLPDPGGHLAGGDAMSLSRDCCRSCWRS